MNNEYRRIESQGGAIQFIENSTGDVLEGVTVTVPNGTRFQTPATQRKIKNRKEAKNRDYFKRRFTDFAGAYFFIKSDTVFELSAITLSRLIYLITYVNYDNKIMRTQKTPMKKEDIPKILNVSQSTATRFLKEVIPKYITFDEKDNLILSNDFCIRGKLDKKQFVKYQQLYVEGIRNLYNSTDRGAQKALGYLMLLLPYINVEYNIACNQDCIYETEIENIELISISDFCNLINYDVTHVNELVYALNRICITHRGRKERICSIVYDGINNLNANICINPHIFYIGKSPNKVDLIGAFCRV